MPARIDHGSRTGQALADTTPTTPVVTVVNGGASHVYFWTVLNNPARVQSAVPGDITYLGKHGKYAYKLILTVPAVLQVVAGVRSRSSRSRSAQARGPGWRTLAARATIGGLSRSRRSTGSRTPAVTGT